MSTDTIVKHGDWTLLLCVDGERRIRDLDLAERLRYARPIVIRKLIKRMIEEGKLCGVHVVSTVETTSMPRGGKRETKAVEYHLTRDQALKVAAHSDTDVADAILDEIIKVFGMALDGKLQAPRHPRVELLDRFLLQERAPLERLFEPPFLTVVCQLHGTRYQPGDHAPVWFKGFVGRLYRLMLGEDVHLEMKARGNKRDLYEYLTPDALRLVRTNMDIVTVLACQSCSLDELTRRLRAYFAHEGFQFALELDTPKSAKKGGSK